MRYPAAKGLDGSSDMSFRDLVPTKLAAAIWNSIDTYKTSIPNFPQTETCELLIVDRSVDKVLHNTLIVLLNVFSFFFFFLCVLTHVYDLDYHIFQIAPVIHEWTYDAMCHDLLGMDGNKYLYEV